MPSRLPPELPRDEPEVIPPGGTTRARPSGRIRIWVATNGERLGASGLLTALVAVLALGIFAAVILALILGTFLLWLPVVIALIIAMLGSAFMRGFGRRNQR